MSEESESSMKDANCAVLQFCSATREGLDGVAIENFTAENFSYERGAEALSCA
jgi:hypothetical protein